jgi:hypothetical protein
MVRRLLPFRWRGLSARTGVAANVLLWCLITSICGASSVAADMSRGRFMVATSDGAVAVIVEGMATGVTNSALTRLIRAGVAGAYFTYCAAAPDLAAARQKIHWHVISDGRKATALISVDLVQDGKASKAIYSHVAAPGANPPGVFEHEVRLLARQILPPATTSDGAVRTSPSILDRCD